MEEIDLVQAFMWTCPECAEDHFVRAITVQMTREEMTKELREMGQLEEWEEIPEDEEHVWTMAPNKVECCGKTYKTAEIGSEWSP